MSFKLFIPQATIDSWVSTDQVELQGDVITMKSTGFQFQLVPASFFRAAAGGSDDTHQLTGRVKDQWAIDALGGEAYMSSVVIGDAAYDVEPGFLATSGGGNGTTALSAEVLSTLRHMQDAGVL
jgi:hypothetical protein